MVPLTLLLLQILAVWSCPPDNPSGGDSPLLPSVDFPGADIEKLRTPDERSCQLICTNHPNCHFFSYHAIDPETGERGFDCHLKNSSSEVPENSKRVPGVTSGYSLPKTPENINRCLGQSYDEVEFLGNVLAFGLVGSREECEASCTRNPGCQFYTYYPPDTPADPSLRQRCYLQYSTSLPSPPNVTLTAGAQSGFSQRACCTGLQCSHACADLIFSDMRFSGGVTIGNVRTGDVTACQASCSQHPLCQFFTFSLHADLWCECYLQRSASGLPDNVTRVTGMFSGFGKQVTEPGFLGCADLLSHDSEYEGLAVMEAEVEDVTQCQQMCSKHAACRYFTVLPGGPDTAHGMSICRLKTSAENIPTSITPRLGATSGFGLQYNTVQKNIQNCSLLLYPDVEFSGVLLLQISSEDAESCRSSCAQHPECTFFTFNTSSLTCALRRSLSGVPVDIISAPNATSGFSLDIAGLVDCSSLLFPHTTFSGSLIGYMMSPDEEHCRRLCTQNPLCQFFTHLTAQWSLDDRRFFCFLQSSGHGVPDNVFHLPNSTSGFSGPLGGTYRECVPDVYEGLEFPEADQRSLKAASYEDCRSLCTQDSLCQFFTFFTDLLPGHTGTCYLKSLLSVPLPQIIRYEPGVVSGFPQRNCEGHPSDSPPDVLPSC